MLDKSPIRFLRISAILLVLARLVSLPFNVITDLTEARYARIGMKMFLTNNFVTPFIEDGVPFWAKPPLSFWSTAISYFIFGVNQFSAHFPHFLFLLGTVVLMYFFIKKYFSELIAWTSTVIVLTFPVFIYLMGGIMTDPALTLAVTLSFVSFFNALYCDKKPLLWGYLFFVGLALALLAKGPLVLVLVGFPVGLWVIIKNKWKDIWHKIPWFTGTLLMFAIALPWYILAEIRTEGFLRYFIIGEHFERYLVPNWKGDLYGSGRGGFRGVIWVYLLASTLPWSIYIICKSFCKDFRSNFINLSFFRDDKISYLVLWVIAPLVFFTFSRNVILPYILPFLAPLAALIGIVICANEQDLKTGKFKIAVAFNILLLFAFIMVEIFIPELVRSDKYIIDTYKVERANKEIPLLYFKRKIRYSTDFYSQGIHLYTIKKKEQIAAHANKYDDDIFVLVDDDQLSDKELWEGLNVDIVSKHKGRILIKVRPSVGRSRCSISTDL